MTPAARIRMHTWLAWAWLVLAIAATIGWALIDPNNRYLLAWRGPAPRRRQEARALEGNGHA